MMTNLGTVRFLCVFFVYSRMKVKPLYSEKMLECAKVWPPKCYNLVVFRLARKPFRGVGLMKTRQDGFSLIELLVVVAIILIIAAIAIPNFLRAKISANESSAVSSVHAVDTAEIGYSATYTDIGYSASLADLGPGTGTGTCPATPTASCFIDPALASGTKSGYLFTYVQNASITPSIQFTINADPQIPDVTGQRGFYSDQSNVIRYNSTGAANSSSPSL